MDLDKLIRKLAKGNHYQTIYSQEKNLGLSLFRNKSDLTYIQITFLGYLSFYSSLYFDCAIGEVDEKIFESGTYEDAYAYYRRKTKNKLPDNAKRPVSNISKKSKVADSVTTSQWVFKSKKVK